MSIKYDLQVLRLSWTRALSVVDQSVNHFKMKGSIKLAFVVVFLCVVARQTRGQSGHWEESSGDGSGSGSGNGGAEEWRCRRLSDLPGVNRTRNKELDKLKTTMKCHVACMEKVRAKFSTVIRDSVVLDNFVMG